MTPALQVALLRSAEPTQAELEKALAFALDCYPGKSERYQNQIAAAWMRGYMNKPNPYEMRRGGNFAAGFRSAYRDGQQAYRRKLQATDYSDAQGRRDEDAVRGETERHPDG